MLKRFTKLKIKLIVYKIQSTSKFQNVFIFTQCLYIFGLTEFLFDNIIT